MRAKFSELKYDGGGQKSCCASKGCGQVEPWLTAEPKPVKGVDTAARADLTAFPDAEKASAYARDALSWAVAAELVKGTKEGSTIYLDPQGSATRAQVAAILSRYAQNIVK